MNATPMPTIIIAIITITITITITFSPQPCSSVPSSLTPSPMLKLPNTAINVVRLYRDARGMWLMSV
jgi:hypothetical protein